MSKPMWYFVQLIVGEHDRRFIVASGDSWLSASGSIVYM